jgi:hypothetical protein
VLRGESLLNLELITTKEQKLKAIKKLQDEITASKKQESELTVKTEAQPDNAAAIKNLDQQIVKTRELESELKAVQAIKIKPINLSIKADDKEAKKQAAIIKGYYDTVRFLDSTYLDYRKGIIDEQTALVLKATGDEVQAAQFKNAKLKKLDNERLEDIRAAAEETRKIQLGRDTKPDLKPVADPGESPALPDVSGTESFLSPAYWDVIDQKITEFGPVQETLFNSINEGLASIKRGENPIRVMANVFIDSVNRMIAKWLAFKAITTIGNLIAPGAGTAVAQIAGAKHGGSFTGGFKGVAKVPKAAAGGSFMVPPGFSGDTGLLRVSSHERVDVTPSAQVGKDLKMLVEINGSIQAMNKNMVAMSLRQSRMEEQIEFTQKGTDLVATVDLTNRIKGRLQ